MDAANEFNRDINLINSYLAFSCFPFFYDNVFAIGYKLNANVFSSKLLIENTIFLSPTVDGTAFVRQRQYLHFSAGHLIGCDKNQKLCNIFQVDCAIRQDYYAINYAIFSGLIYWYIVSPGFKGEKPLQCCLKGNLNVKE